MPPTDSKPLKIDPRLLQTLKNIELKSRFLVRGLYNSRHRTSDFGSSTEFIEYRDYEKGDDIRTIDWRAFARTDRLYVKRFEMEANMKVHFLLDVSDSMRVPPAPGLPSKLDLAATIVGAVATMVIHQQDSAGLYCIGDKIEERIPPSQGLRHLSLLFQHLGSPRGSGGNNFGKLVSDLLPELGTRGFVVVVSDAVDEPQPLFDALKGCLVREQDVTLFQVLDRDELEFPFDRMTEFRDPERPRKIMGDPTTLRHRYLERLHAHLEAIKDFSKRNRVDYVRLHNGEDLAGILTSHFLRRLMMRRVQK